jgi:hypothetical protein
MIHRSPGISEINYWRSSHRLRGHLPQADPRAAGALVEVGRGGGGEGTGERADERAGEKTGERTGERTGEKLEAKGWRKKRFTIIET